MTAEDMKQNFWMGALPYQDPLPIKWTNIKARITSLDENAECGKKIKAVCILFVLFDHLVNAP
jgi:hypothetical protein